ncbi:unnamed protein product [Adineta ricciae]|nr:unnamed protein product [Adineta ricciae]
MYLVNLPKENGIIFRFTATNLTVGFRYEFSTYLANICCQMPKVIKPNILFKVGSVSSYGLSAFVKELATRNISEYIDTTWHKYSLTFKATHSSLTLSMISEKDRGAGNVIAIDDIELRLIPPNQLDVCSSESDGSFPIKKDGLGKSVFLITFGNGSCKCLKKETESFNFSTKFIRDDKCGQSFHDGYFSFRNSISGFSGWHNGESDHTADDNGYMFLVNLGGISDFIFRLNVTNINIGSRYEFSTYLANIFKPSGMSVKPNVRFKVESILPNGVSLLIAQLVTGDISECAKMTWIKYSLPFTATSSLVILTIISEKVDIYGNDIAIDDIELRLCSAACYENCSSMILSTTAPAACASDTITTTMSMKDELTTRLTAITTTITTMKTTETIRMTTTELVDRTTIRAVTTTRMSSKLPMLYFIPEACHNMSTISRSCNISNSPCEMMKPCLNDGTCTDDRTTTLHYRCSCLLDFSGSHCEFDNRTCTKHICLNNGQCDASLKKPFYCKCKDGWYGPHCQWMEHGCKEGLCLNRGVCQPIPRNYTCRCLEGSYYGRHCEFATRRLTILRIASKSLGYIAIIAIMTVVLFVVILDILKYCFGIDVTGRELARYRREKRRKRRVIQRFVYVNAIPQSTLKTTAETSP